MKQEFNFKNFIKNLDSQLSEARTIVDDLEEMSYYSDVAHERYEFNKLKLEGEIFEMHLKVIFALEYLGLTTLLEKFTGEFERYKDNLTTLNLVPYIDILHSPVVSLIWHFKNVINCQFEDKKSDDVKMENDLSTLERMLRGTAKIIADRKVQPKNEADVQKEIYNILLHVFPDTVREIPIPKVVKTFKPDLGVKHLKCAIEYKFVDSEKEAKSCIGGIFEDMMGYEGTDDWKTFFAVIYMTDNYMTQDQIEAEFKLSKAKKNWKPIVVFGKGERKKLPPTKVIPNKGLGDQSKNSTSNKH
jgi:hypothetical protein